MRRKDGKAWSSDGRRDRLTSPPPLTRLGRLAAFASTLPPAAHSPGPPPSWPRAERVKISLQPVRLAPGGVTLSVEYVEYLLGLL
jgi:hypothetical protein